MYEGFALLAHSLLVAIATVKIRLNFVCVFARKLTWYFIGIYIINTPYSMVKHIIRADILRVA